MAHRAFVRVVALALTGVTVSGCMADFVGPLAVTAHRYPNVRLTRTAAAQPPADLSASAEPADDQQPVARHPAKRHAVRHVRPSESVGSNQNPLDVDRQSKADIAAAEALRSRLAQDPGRLSQPTALIAERRPASGQQ